MSVSGADGISKALKDIGKGIDGAVNKAIVRTANQVRAKAINSISRERSYGRVYERGSVVHVASAEGEAPNTDTGRLVSSIAVESPRRGLSYVGTSLEYGNYLEFGTTRMAARPWLRPAMKANEAELTQNITNAIKEAITNVRGGG